MSRWRNFCFTLNNPTDAEKTYWTSFSSEEVRTAHKLTYIVFQTERCPTTGTIHLQGYVEMSTQRTRDVILNVFDATNRRHRLHVSKRRMSQALNIAYCKKEASRVPGPSLEAGEAKRCGQDNLRVTAQAILQGATFETIMDEYPATDIQFHDKIASYIIRRQPKRNSQPQIYILWGSTGTGKTAFARAHWPGAYTVPNPEKGGWWWYNYQGQKTILLDDWKGNIPYNTGLRLFDRYDFVVQAKGTNFDMLANTIILTLNIDPYQLYPGVHNKSALHRRFDEFATILHFRDDSTWDNPSYDITKDNNGFTPTNFEDHMSDEETTNEPVHNQQGEPDYQDWANIQDNLDDMYGGDDELLPTGMTDELDI